MCLNISLFIFWKALSGEAFNHLSPGKVEEHICAFCDQKRIIFHAHASIRRVRSSLLFLDLEQVEMESQWKGVETQRLFI